MNDNEFIITIFLSALNYGIFKCVDGNSNNLKFETFEKKLIEEEVNWNDMFAIDSEDGGVTKGGLTIFDLVVKNLDALFPLYLTHSKGYVKAKTVHYTKLSRLSNEEFKSIKNLEKHLGLSLMKVNKIPDDVLGYVEIRHNVLRSKDVIHTRYGSGNGKGYIVIKYLDIPSNGIYITNVRIQEGIKSDDQPDELVKCYDCNEEYDYTECPDLFYNNVNNSLLLNKQYDLQEEIIDKGFGLVTCANCGSVNIHKFKK